MQFKKVDCSFLIGIIGVFLVLILDYYGTKLILEYSPSIKDLVQVTLYRRLMGLLGAAGLSIEIINGFRKSYVSWKGILVCLLLIVIAFIYPIHIELFSFILDE